MPDPRVAVLLPTLNGEPFIGEQIDALARQDVDFAWHLVVVDGGSTDGTLDVVRARTTGRIPTTIVQLHGAPGVNAGLNAGVRATTSEILVIAEHDDVVAIGWLAAICRALDTHWLVGSHMDRHQLNDPTVVGSRRTFLEEVQLRAPVAISTGMGFRRELWDLLDGFDESYRYGGNDIEYCLRAYLAGHPAQLVDDALVHYRIRPGSRQAFRQARSYGKTTVRIHDEFGTALVPRRPARHVTRDYARLVAWAVRALGDRSYRMRLAFRGGLLLGYLEGSVKYRTWFM